MYRIGGRQDHGILNCSNANDARGSRVFGSGIKFKGLNFEVVGFGKLGCLLSNGEILDRFAIE